MAGDILLFNATHVPVGHDQIQHVEIARDIAGRFNKSFNAEGFVLPEHVVADEIAEIPGLDGRKMSKSYGNTIPLYVGRKAGPRRFANLLPIQSNTPMKQFATQHFTTYILLLLVKKRLTQLPVNLLQKKSVGRMQKTALLMPLTPVSASKPQNTMSYLQTLTKLNKFFQKVQRKSAQLPANTSHDFVQLLAFNDYVFRSGTHSHRYSFVGNLDDTSAGQKVVSCSKRNTGAFQYCWLRTMAASAEAFCASVS